MAAIDLTVVQELLDLCDEGDAAFLVELIEVFLHDTPSRVTAIVDGCDAGDLDAVGFAAHALKGSAGNLGARTLQHLAEAFQAACRSGDLTAARGNVHELETAYAAAADELNGLVRRLTPR